jgi:hypothetical protein
MKNLLKIWIPIVILFGISELNTYNQIQKVREDYIKQLNYVMEYVDKSTNYGLDYEPAVDTSFVDISEVAVKDTAEYNAYMRGEK